MPQAPPRMARCRQCFEERNASKHFEKVIEFPTAGVAVIRSQKGEEIIRDGEKATQYYWGDKVRVPLVFGMTPCLNCKDRKLDIPVKKYEPIDKRKQAKLEAKKHADDSANGGTSSKVPASSAKR